MTGNSSTDNRILAPGITRELEYRSNTEEGTLYLGDEAVTIRADFKTAHRIAQHFRLPSKAGE